MSISGDGLVKPLNAPDGQQLAPGIQPGVTGPVIQARIVIVSGAGGEILIYNGAAGAGTLKGSWTAAAGTDPFGNPTQNDLTVYAVSNSGYVNISSTGGLGGNTAVLLHPGGTAHATTQPQVLGGSFNTGAANEIENLHLSSGQAGGNDAADFLMQSAAADNSTGALADWQFGGLIVMTLTKLLLTIGVPVTATAGTASAQTTITTDTWHAMSLSANWSTIAGQPIPSYKFSAVDNMMCLEGAAQFNANIANTGLATALPSSPNYRPLTQIYVAGARGSAGLQVSSNGGLVAVVDAGQATTFCNFNGTIPLDL